MACHAYAPCTRHAHALCTCLRVHRRWLRRGVLLDGGAGVVGQRESESGAGDKVAPHPWRCRHGVRRSRRHVVIWDSHRTGRHDASHEASLFKGAPCGSHRRCVPWRGLPSGCVPLLSWSAGARPRAHQLRGGWFLFWPKTVFFRRPKKAGGRSRRLLPREKFRAAKRRVVLIVCCFATGGNRAVIPQRLLFSLARKERDKERTCKYLPTTAGGGRSRVRRNVVEGYL